MGDNHPHLKHPMKTNSFDRKTYTTEEVAEILKLHPVFTRRLFTRGDIPGAIRIGRVWRLPAEALDEILKHGIKMRGVVSPETKRH